MSPASLPAHPAHHATLPPITEVREESLGRTLLLWTLLDFESPLQLQLSTCTKSALGCSKRAPPSPRIRPAWLETVLVLTALEVAAAWRLIYISVDSACGERVWERMQGSVSRLVLRSCVNRGLTP